MQSEEQSRPRGAHPDLTEAESLIWHMLDNRLDDAGAGRLATLLEHDDAIRRRYLECMQLHVDLQDHFAAPPAAPERARPNSLTPALWFSAMPGTESSPISE